MRDDPSLPLLALVQELRDEVAHVSTQLRRCRIELDESYATASDLERRVAELEHENDELRRQVHVAQ
jgi:septal ring factor EnvC (AmiA/AmiB activator)